MRPDRIRDRIESAIADEARMAIEERVADWLELQLLDADGEVVAESRGLYQMRAH